MKHSIKLIGLIFISLISLIKAQAQSHPSENKPPFPDIQFEKRIQGQQAINELGDRLPDVAAWYGMSVSEFAKTIRTDSSAWLDKKGRLVFIDTFPEPSEPAPESSSQAAPFPLSETFNLHSRPGANRVIYLDFDGHTTSGTAWNASSGVDPIISPPYNREGDSSSFTTLELEYIQKMWQQVAEDFAPFDVNVTTADPGQAAITRSSNTDNITVLAW